MRPDVLTLKAYYVSALGQQSAALIAAHLPRANPGARVLLLGYGQPYLSKVAGEAERVVAAMPARQGAICISYGSKRAGKSNNVTCLTDVEHLPFDDAVFDQIILVHCLEFSGRVGTTLKEVSRVLATGGRVTCVVPNRAGPWCRVEATPFGNGRPFSVGQLTDLLREAQLAATGWQSALMLPPFAPIARWMPRMEATGQALWARFGGVYVVDAKKEVFAAKLSPKKAGGAHAAIRVPVFTPANARSCKPNNLSA